MITSYLVHFIAGANCKLPHIPEKWQRCEAVAGLADCPTRFITYLTTQITKKFCTALCQGLGV